MTLLALIFALFLEQLRALPVERAVDAPLRRISAFLRERFDDETIRTGWVVWAVFVLASSAAVGYAYLVFAEWYAGLGLLFNIAVLYLTMGFRHEAHYFSEIHLALRAGELQRARELATEWHRENLSDASESAVARVAIERALVAAHRTVFGVSFWFVVLPGPSGALLYRLARFFAQEWSQGDDPECSGFGAVGRQALELLDWIPARLTAIGFSVAGNFEDALLCWRAQARQWPSPSEGILIASGAGAIGVKLGLAVDRSGNRADSPEMGTGEKASVDSMQSTIGLVWRTLVLCLLSLTLFGIAGWVGG